MKIAFIINDHETEKANYTTPALGYAAYKRDHEVFFIGIGELAYAADGHFSARCKTIKEANFKSQETFFKAVQRKNSVKLLRRIWMYFFYATIHRTKSTSAVGPKTPLLYSGALR